MQTQQTNPARIAALDGWRGIAILLVLFDHFQVAKGTQYFGVWSQTGHTGVIMFFVLSGYLITGKLLEPRVSLRKFYVRRLFRLMPAAWTYLAFILLLGVVFHVQLMSAKEVFACVVFFRNTLGSMGLGLTEHFWSLSIEEQFYLVWPATLLLVGAQRCRWLASFAATTMIAWCVLHHSYYQQPFHMFYTEVNAPALLVGCLLALTPWNPRLPLANRALSLPLLTWFGRLSYSLYLWNFFCFHLWRTFPLTGLFTFLIPIASYYWIERPCVALGHRLTVRANAIQCPRIGNLEHSEGQTV